MLAECVSYPKSGRTWLRFMLRNLDLDTSLRFHHDKFDFNDGKRPPHSFDVSLRLSRYGPDARVVFLDRDPRDVMVSLFHQVTGRFRDFFAYEGDISSFIRDPYFGAEVLRRFRGMWGEVLAERSFLLVRYEDLHANTAHELGRVLAYIGAAADADRIAAAVDAGRLENMRAVESSGAFAHPWLRPRNGFAKVRKGRAGGFVDELGEDDIVYLNGVFGFPPESLTTPC